MSDIEGRLAALERRMDDLRIYNNTIIGHVTAVRALLVVMLSGRNGADERVIAEAFENLSGLVPSLRAGFMEEIETLYRSILNDAFDLREKGGRLDA